MDVPVGHRQCSGELFNSRRCSLGLAFLVAMLTFIEPMVIVELREQLLDREMELDE
jgi:hypothetical protein